MKQSPSLEANSRSARQEIPRLLLNYKSHSKALCNISKRAGFPRSEVVTRHRNSRAGGSPIFSCRRLLIQYTRSYPPISGGRALHPKPGDACILAWDEHRSFTKRLTGLTRSNV
jgi:hypothetical protein